MGMQCNVVVILCDQLRKDVLGCYGNKIVETPNIDNMAEVGVLFNRCYAANPICMPNRLSLFTGMYPRNHGMWTNGLFLEHEVPTMAGFLGDEGYETASFGKIHFEPKGAKKSKESRTFWQEHGDNINWCGPYWGFQHVELTLGHAGEPIAHYGKWFYQHGGTENMQKLHKVSGAPGSGVKDIPIQLHDTMFVASRTADYIRGVDGIRDKSKPFFAVASFPDPHHPFNPPRVLAEKYYSREIYQPVSSQYDILTRPEHYKQHMDGAWHRSGTRPAVHPGGFPKEYTEEYIRHYYAMVDLIDQGVGEILHALEEEGLEEDTLVIFTSDHGELLGDHGLWQKGPFFYEGLVNIPLIVRWKGRLSRLITDELASSVDILPTIFELLDKTVPEQTDGVSLAACLRTGVNSIREHCLLEYRNGYGKVDKASFMLVEEKFKLVMYQDGKIELTDLIDDPHEYLNLASKQEYASEIQRMQSKLLLEILSTGSKWPAQVSQA